MAKSEAMYQIRSISSKLERARNNLNKEYNERIKYTKKLYSDLNHEAKYLDRIDLSDKHIHDLKVYIDDLLTDLKYQVDQYDTEIDTEVRIARKTIDSIQTT